MLMYIAADVEVTTPDMSCSPHRSPLDLVKLPVHVHLDEPKALLHLSQEEKTAVSRRWVLDTSATNHMTGSRSVFAELNTGVIGTVKFGDGSVVDIKGKGTILFVCKSGEHRHLDGVYYIPCLTTNIVSLGQMDEDGFKVNIESGVLCLYDLQRKLPAKVHRSPSRLYLLDMNTAAPVCLTARVGDVAWRWHERYSHLNFQSLRKLGCADMVCGLPAIDHVDQVCEDCVLAKQKRTPFSQAAKYRAQEELELVHGDLCGPISPPTPAENAYFLLLVDDMSRYMWLTLLRSKADAPAAIMAFQARVEREIDKKLKVLRTDNGGEFTSVQFGKYCAGEGIQRHHSAPYSPQQNGVVERRNQMIVNTARSILRAWNMPRYFGERRCTPLSSSSTGRLPAHSTG
jgi:transposase InsO family protein